MCGGAIFPPWVGQLMSSEHTGLGFPNFLNENPEGFIARVLWILDRCHRVHVLRRETCVQSGSCSGVHRMEAALASHPPATGTWNLEPLAFGKMAWYSPQAFFCKRNCLIPSGLVVDYKFFFSFIQKKVTVALCVKY